MNLFLTNLYNMNIKVFDLLCVLLAVTFLNKLYFEKELYTKVNKLVFQKFWLISFIILTVVDCARVICGWLYECNNPKYVILSRVAEEQTNISVLDSIDNILQKYTIAQYTSDVTGECAVCLNDFDESNELIKLNCDHIFHLECIANWNRIQSTCPSCRNEYLQLDNSVNSTDATTATISTDTTDMTNSTDTAANNV